MQGKSIINKRSAGIIVACLILLTGRINAQHSHSHDDGIATGHKSIPPHGGLVEDAGKYHFEIVFDVFSATQKLSVWTLKSNFKVIEPKEYTGTVKFEYKDGKSIQESFITSSDRLYCNVEDITQAFTAYITIAIKGKEYQVVYVYPGFKDVQMEN